MRLIAKRTSANGGRELEAVGLVLPSVGGGRAASIAVFLIGLAGGCGPDGKGSARHPYAPIVREIAVTTVPLLVKEQQGVLPFLKKDFAKGGVLEGKEVYAFSPGTITVVEGDTIHFTFINPEDDVHSFVMHDLVVQLPPQTSTKATYVARHAGVFGFVCSVASHLPMMAGQLVVLVPPG